MSGVFYSPPPLPLGWWARERKINGKTNFLKRTLNTHRGGEGVLVS